MSDVINLQRKHKKYRKHRKPIEDNSESDVSKQEQEKKVDVEVPQEVSEEIVDNRVPLIGRYE